LKYFRRPPPTLVKIVIHNMPKARQKKAGGPGRDAPYSTARPEKHSATNNIFRMNTDLG
jgi:hypothetical protein